MPSRFLEGIKKKENSPLFAESVTPPLRPSVPPIYAPSAGPIFNPPGSTPIIQPLPFGDPKAALTLPQRMLTNSSIDSLFTGEALKSVPYGALQTGSGLANAMSMAGGGVEAKAVKALLDIAANKLKPEGPKSFAEQVASGVGSSLPFLAGGLAMPGIAMRVGVPTALEAAVEAGHVAEEAKQKGIEEKSAALKTFLGNFPAVYLTNKLGGLYDPSKSFKRKVLGGLFEVPQEMSQQAVSNIALEEPLLKGMKETASVSAVVGPLLGAGVGGVESLAKAGGPDFFPDIFSESGQIGPQKGKRNIPKTPTQIESEKLMKKPATEVKEPLQYPEPEKLNDHIKRIEEDFKKFPSEEKSGILKSEEEISHGGKEKKIQNVERLQASLDAVRRDSSSIRKPSPSTLAKEYFQKGFVDHSGKEIKEPSDAAELASAFRSPYIENLQIIYVKDGIVKAHNTLSSGVPNYVDSGGKEGLDRMLYRIKSAAERLNADTIYFAHNHPTGDPKPSGHDIIFTNYAGSVLQRYGIRLSDHVVIDDDHFYVINSETSSKRVNLTSPKPSLSREVLSNTVNNAVDAANAAKDLFDKKKINVMFLDSKHRVVSFESVSPDKNIRAFVSQGMKRNLASAYIIIHDKNTYLPMKVFPVGALDVIRVFDEEGYLSYADSGALKTEDIKFKQFYRVQEDKPLYKQPESEGWDDLSIEAKTEYKSQFEGFTDKQLVKELSDLVSNFEPGQTIMDMEGNYSRLSLGFLPEFSNRGYTKKYLQNIYKKYGEGSKLTDKQAEDLVYTLNAFKEMFGIKPSESIPDIMTKENIRKSKANIQIVRSIGKALGRGVPAGDIKPIVQKTTGISKPSTPTTIEESKLLKMKFKEQQKGAVAGERKGKEIGEAKSENVLKQKIENIKRKFELVQLKQDMLSRDKSESEKAKLKARYEELLSEITRKEEMKLLKRDIELRSKFIQEKQRVKDIMASKKARKELSDEIKSKIKFIKEMPTQGLPIEYKDMIEEIKQSVDFESVGLKKILTREKIRAQLEQDDLKEQVRDLTNITARDMTLEDLRFVHDTIQRIYHEGMHANQFLTMKKEHEFDALVTQGTESIKKSGGIPAIPNIEKISKDFTNKPKNLVSKFIAESRRPEAIIESFDGYKENGVNYEVIWKPLNKAVNDKITNIEETTNKLAWIFKDVNIAEVLGKRVKIKGIKRPLLRDEMMFIYANSFNEINLEHIINSGVPEESIYDIQKKLTDAEKKSIEDLFHFYDEDQYPRLDKVYSSLKGRHLKKEENYFPIIGLEHVGDIDAVEMDVVNRAKFIMSGIPKSFTKERTGGTKAFKNFSFFKTLYRNISQVEHYISHAEAIRDISKYLKNPDVQDAIKDNFGEPVYIVMDRWVNDMARGRDESTGRALDDFVLTLRGNYVLYALGVNLSTIIKQPASFIQGAEYIGKTWALKGLIDFVHHPLDTIAFVRAKSTQMKHRRFTQERELREIMEGRGIAKKFNQKDLHEIKNMIREGTMAPIMWADQMTVVILWKGAYQKKINDLATEEEAIEYADKAIRRTQPQARLVDLPDLFRSSPFMKMLTVFKNQPNQNFNLLYDSFLKYKKSGDGGGKVNDFKKFSSEIFYYLVVSGLFFSVLMRRRLPKDTQEVVWSLANQALGGLPIVGDLLTKVEYPWGSANMIDSVVSDATKIITSKKSGIKAKYAGKTAAQVFGVPGYVAAERAVTRENLKTKFLGGEREKKAKNRVSRFLGGKSSGSRRPSRFLR